MFFTSWARLAILNSLLSVACPMSASSDLTSILMATDTLVGKCTPPQTVLVSCIQVVWGGINCSNVLLCNKQRCNSSPPHPGALELRRRLQIMGSRNLKTEKTDDSWGLDFLSNFYFAWKNIEKYTVKLQTCTCLRLTDSHPFDTCWHKLYLHIFAPKIFTNKIFPYKFRPNTSAAQVTAQDGERTFRVSTRVPRPRGEREEQTRKTRKTEWKTALPRTLKRRFKRKRFSPLFFWKNFLSFFSPRLSPRFLLRFLSSVPPDLLSSSVPHVAAIAPWKNWKNGKVRQKRHLKPKKLRKYQKVGKHVKKLLQIWKRCSKSMWRKKRQAKKKVCKVCQV